MSIIIGIDHGYYAKKRKPVWVCEECEDGNP